MLKTTLKIAALSVVSFTLLSACGASDPFNKNQTNNGAYGSGLNGNSGDSSFRNLNSGGGNLNIARPIIDSTVVSLRYTGQYNPRDRNNSHNLTSPVKQDTFALNENSDGNLVMTVNGTDYIFIATENTPYVSSDPGKWRGSTVVFQAQSADYEEPTTYNWKAAGAGHLYQASTIAAGLVYPDFRDVIRGGGDVHGTYIFYSTLDHSSFDGSSIDLDYTEGYATIGVQTLPEVVASQTATAYYRGVAELQWPETQVVGRGFKDKSLSQILDPLEIMMAVDFTGNTVEGLMTFHSSFNEGYLNHNTQPIITLNSAPIVGNGFAGTFSMNDKYRNMDGIVDNPMGSYAGNFFGPNADDIAGVMQYNGTTAQGAVVGVGGFRADNMTELLYGGGDTVRHYLETVIQVGDTIPETGGNGLFGVDTTQ